MAKLVGVKLSRLNIWSFQVFPAVTTICRASVPGVLVVVEIDRVALVPVQLPLAVKVSQLLKRTGQTTVGVGVEVIVGVGVLVEVKVAVGRVPVGVAVTVGVKVEVAKGLLVAVGVKVTKAWFKVTS